MTVTSVRARVVSWDDETFPPTVEVELDLADGTAALLRDKAPVLGAEPGEIEVRLSCRLVDHAGAMTENGVDIELDHGVTSVDDQARFTVRQDQVMQ